MRLSRVRTVSIVVLAGILAQPPLARAAEVDEGSRASKSWELDFLPYVWLIGSFGTVEAHGRSAKVDTTIKDSLDLLTSGHAFGASSYLELRHDRVWAYVDGFGGYTEEGARVRVPIERFPRLGNADIAARLKVKPAYIDFGLGYRVGEWALPGRTRPFTLGMYVGGRYYFTYTKLTASVAISKVDVHRATDVSGTTSLADPLIGVRWELPLLDDLTFGFRGDIGGFHAASTVAWNLIGQVRWWVPMTIGPAQPWLAVGYRALGFDQTINGVNQDLQTRGPFLGVGLTL